MKTVVILLVLAAAVGAWFLWFSGGESSDAPGVRFRTAKVDRGEVIEGVQASGAVQPVVLVQVGTQISGVIDKLFADFNSKVTAGQTIAILDSRRLASQIAQDEASVVRARAEVDRVKAALLQGRSEIQRVKAAGGQAKADVERMRALLTQSEKDLERQRTLAERHLTAPADLDAAVATKGSLDAQLASAIASIATNEAQIVSAEAAVQQNEAQVAVAEAAVLQAQAQLQGDKVNLDYATIVSPVDGVIVSRNVDVGQTVAASLSAPTLFVIANDLTKIQVQTSVPEADIGRIHQGQHTRFTVDAHPDRNFDGMVSQVRLASTTVQNVVTYTVLVDASNPDGLLLPGMTANVTFEIQRSPPDTLRVASSALRLQAPAELLETPATPAADAGADAKPADAKPADGATAGDGAPAAGTRPPRGPRGAGASGGSGGWTGRARRTRGVVYVQTPAGKLRAVAVKIGITDGILTAIEPVEPASLAEGTEVVTAVLRADEPATTNPFAPPRVNSPTGRGGGGPGR